jgi:outer membrane lipoprotein-sorting protein
MKGKLDAGGNARPTLPIPGQKTGPQMPKPRPLEQVQLPFTMELKRPRKMRIELQFNGQTAIQVFDGQNGWKLRPFLNRHEVEPYTPEELKATALQAELDGPLVDYAKKGTKVELEGTEKVGDSEAYKLKLTLQGGQTQHVWIDAKTFLETKIEGTPRRLDGKYHPVATYLRDYQPVNGVMIPRLLETAVEGVKQVERIQIEDVVVNPKLDDSLFAKLK